MKKILLSLGVLTSAVVSTGAIVSCGFGKEEYVPIKATSSSTIPTNNPSATTNPYTPPITSPTNTQAPTTTGPYNPPTTVPTNNPPTISNPYTLPPIQAPKAQIGNPQQPSSKQPSPQSPSSHGIQHTRAFDDFVISDITENPKISGFLPDVTSAPRDFRVFDNGLFKIKIEKTLIGPNKFYSSNAKAKLQATEIANSINVGPAITHLPKGIQILYSSNQASLGGAAGVQIATNNDNQSLNDEGIKNETALVDHEYGHHETMYDFQNLMGGSTSDVATDSRITLKETMIKGLTAAGYSKIADVISKADPNKDMNKDASLGPNWLKTVDSDMPSDYGNIHKTGHSIFGTFDYPFDGAEITTRMLNILSFRSDISAQNVYGETTTGRYSDGRTLCEPPAAFISDATIRHFAKDSVFGGGKDNSRVSKLIDFYMSSIFGRSKATLDVRGDANSGEISGLDFTNFAGINGLDHLEVKDSSQKDVVEVPLNSFNSQFGFKNELISDHWTTTYNDKVQYNSNFKLDLPDAGTHTYSIYGYNASGGEVDLTSISFSNMIAPSGGLWKNHTHLKHMGTHIIISR